MRMYAHFFSIWLIVVITLFLAGCNAKKYYTPGKIDGQIVLHQSFGSPIESSNRYGATLKNGTILTQSGFLPPNKTITKDVRFLNESGGYYIFAKGCESVQLIKTSVLDERVFENGVCTIKEQNTACTDEEIEIPTNFCAITASLKNNLLALIGRDNSMYIFDLSKNRLEPKFSQKGSSVIAVNELIAAPLFLESIVVFPTLDGRLLVVSTKKFETERNIIVSTDKFFNNIIYLEGDDLRIFAATPKKLISILSGQEFSYNTQIKDVLFHKGYLYVLTLDGKIAQLDQTLREINTQKFAYASLEGMAFADNMLFTLEKNGGFFIAVDLANFNYKVYQAQDTFGKIPPNKNIFYSKNMLYYDAYYFDCTGLK